MADTGKKVIARELEAEIRDSYMDYAMSVIISRALPDVRDGLKPVQRRILVAMRELGAGPTSATVKCAKVCGDTMGNYHPHGAEENIYPALVRMAQDFNARYPLIEGQGNMGSVDGDPPAAMRYTEVRMSPLAMEVLEDPRRRRWTSSPTSMRAGRSRWCCPAVSPTCSATAAPASPLAWPPTSRRTIWARWWTPSPL